MAQEKPRPSVADGPWNAGMDSFLHPTELEPGAYAWSMNTTSRGGTVQTRPGRRLVASFVGQNVQALEEFVTLNDEQYLVVVVDGRAWWGLFPFAAFQRIEGLRMNAGVRRVYLHAAVQAAMLLPTPEDGSDATPTTVGIPGDGTAQPTGDPSTETLVILPNPINWLIFQAGVSNPGWWDGSKAYQPQIPDGANGLPIGTAMASSGNRLWLAQGTKVLASDLLNPLRFTERTYVAEADGFRFPRAITAMLDAPADAGIFVATDQSLHTLQSSIQDRTQWQETKDFQKEINPEIGIVNQGAIAYQHGLPWIYTAKGLMSLDRAQNANQTSQLVTQDGEVARSKASLSPDLSGVAIGAFENFLLVAVPAASRFNRHTWLMDGGMAQKLKFQMNAFATQPPVWTGVWTGTFPAAFQGLTVHGVQRLYELSYSGGTVPNAGGTACGIHLWEDFQPNAPDARVTPVRCQLETRVFSMPNGDFFQPKFVEVHAVNVRGTVTLEVWLAGLSGNYQKIGASTLAAQEGPFGHPLFEPIRYRVAGFPDTVIQSFRGQSRYLRTPEVLLNTTAPNVDTGRATLVDKGFQVLLKWTGRLGVRAVKLYFAPVTESILGACMPDETGTQNVLLDAVA